MVVVFWFENCLFLFEACYGSNHFDGLSQANEILFKSDHGGKPIDWAVGAMIYEINQEREPLNKIESNALQHVERVVLLMTLHICEHSHGCPGSEACCAACS